MKRTKIILSDSDNDRSDTQIVKTLSLFMPVISGLERRLLPDMKADDELIWRVNSSTESDGQAEVNWMTMRNSTGIDEIVKGNQSFRLVVKAAFGMIYLDPKGNSLYLSDAQNPGSVDDIVKCIAKTLLAI